MKFLDRLKLFIRSTAGNALRAIPVERSSGQRHDRLLREAQAHLTILRADLAKAEQRSDDALVTRLKGEIAELEGLLGALQARQSFGKANAQQATAANTTQAEDMRLDETRVADQIRRLRGGHSGDERSG
ncbi:MAG: hypothetical protein NZM18_03340 [Thermoflexales bacterium]|nr:hypothetical protein [Thermoflexales bacterium]MDW8351261.1 hypothetical protein [Anaerolineae bacterium]